MLVNISNTDTAPVSPVPTTPRNINFSTDSAADQRQSASIVESDFQTGWPENFTIDISFFKANEWYLNSGQAMRSSDRSHIIDVSTL